MTHTLHPDIEKAIDGMMKAIYGEVNGSSLCSVQQSSLWGYVLAHLKPFLNMPTDLKDNEPKPFQPDYVKIDSETKPILTKDNEPLPEQKPICKNCGNTGIVEVYSLAKGTRKLNCNCGIGLEQKQSTIDDRATKLKEAMEYVRDNFGDVIIQLSKE